MQERRVAQRTHLWSSAEFGVKLAYERADRHIVAHENRKLVAVCGDANDEAFGVDDGRL
jgi:hypothetical protein